MNLQNSIREAFSLWPLVVAIADAEERRLDPPGDVDPRMGDCLACAATGQVLDPETCGSLVECAPCGGSGRVEIGEYEEEHDPD